MLILSLGMYGGAGHFLLIRAFHESPASRLAPLLYIRIVWAILLGWMVFGHFPDRMSILGALDHWRRGFESRAGQLPRGEA